MRTDLRARRVFAEVYDTTFHTRAVPAADYWDPRHFRPATCDSNHMPVLARDTHSTHRPM